MRTFDLGVIFIVASWLAIVLSGAALSDAQYPVDADQQTATNVDNLRQAQEWIDRNLYTPQA